MDAFGVLLRVYARFVVPHGKFFLDRLIYGVADCQEFGTELR